MTTTTAPERNVRLRLVFAIAGVTILAAAATAGAALEFPHQIHLEMDLECATCHFAGDDYDASPDRSLCLDCHDASELPKMEAVSAHAADREWIFSHELHVEGIGLDCDSCHDPGTGYEYGPKKADMAECMDCHGEMGASLSCSTCHTVYRDDAAPGPGGALLLDHSASWEMRHGESSRISRESCAFCHQVPDDCQSCHLDVPPRSHTRLFKLQTHGIEAEVDRDRCTTCHVQADFCQACHQDVEPISHRAGWGNPGNLHCTQCHEPLADTSCSTCHDSVQAHFENEPADHVASWGEPVNLHCDSCHLPLADTTCFTCHKDTASHEMPPAFHSGGFAQPANNHCTQCHVPLSDTDCAVCHDGTPSHQTEAPRDTHTGAWGPPANQHCDSCHLPIADEPVCSVCHTAADADHSDAPPPTSHTGNWGEPMNTHCGSCHLPLADTDCAVCHEDTPSHRMEPSSHGGGWAFPPSYEHCTQCHFPVAAEPDCFACHRQEAEHSTAPEMPFDHDTISDCLYCHPARDPINHPVVDDNCTQCHRLP